MEVAEGDRVKVTSDYWRLEFDLRNGGTLDAVVFPHGLGRNLLVNPLRTFVDAWSDRDAPSTQFRSSREGNVERLEFSGQMAAAGRQPGPVAFRTDWLALSTSTVTTSSTWLLFAMGVRTFAIQLVSLVVQDQHRVKLISPDIVQADVDAQVQSRAQIEGAPDEQAGFGCLRGILLETGLANALA